MKFFVAFAATLACALASYAPLPYYGYYAGAYAHAPAQITVLPSGYLADTPEVAAARGAHSAALVQAAAAAAANPDYTSPAYVAPGYAGPYAGAYAYGPAHITVLPSGYLADTPEVAAAKGAHSAAQAQAAAAAAASPDYTSYPYVHGVHY